MSDKKEKVSYFMDKVFPEFIRAFFAALLLVFGTWLAKSSTSKTPADVPFSFGINKDLALLIYFLVLLYIIKLLYSSIKSLIVNSYDLKQLNYDFNDMDDPDFYRTIVSSLSTHGSFVYQIVKGKKPSYDSINSIGLIEISNPKCTKNNCLTEVVHTKTSFGRYKYRCPLCNNKVKSDYGILTLIEQVRLIQRKEILLENIQKEKEKELQLQKEREAFEFLKKHANQDPFDPFGPDPFAKK